MTIIKICLIAFLITLAYTKEYTISDFVGKLFSFRPPSDMYGIENIGLVEQEDGNRLAAYGDFSEDKWTDIVTVNDDKDEVRVLNWDNGSGTFLIISTLSFTDKEIQAVIPGDFNYDGQLDFITVSESEDGTHAVLDLYLRSMEKPYFGGSKSESNLTQKLYPYQQPLVMDIDGNRQLDMLIIGSGDGSEVKRQFMTLNTDSKGKYSWNFFDFSDYRTTFDGCLDTVVDSYQFQVPHSSAFYDMNGDCAADLLLQTHNPTTGDQFLEIWLRDTNDKNKLCLKSLNNITIDIVSISLGDVNNDGSIDIIYADKPASDGTTSNIHVIMNQHQPSVYDNCKSSFMEDPYRYKLESKDIFNTLTSIPGSVNVLPLNLTSIGLPTVRLFSEEGSRVPGKIRLGDVDVDGHPDILITVIDSHKVGVDTYGQTVLMLNTGSNFSYSAAGSYQSYYTNDGTVKIYERKTLYASFFDFGELGGLGYWLVCQHDDNSSTYMEAVFNFVYSENFFFKANVLNGKTGKNDDSPDSYAALYYGPSMEIVISDLSGTYFPAKGIQLPQSAHNPLEIIYMMIGLGRTNNYVQNFTVGVPAASSQKDVQTTMWTPFTPNSQLIVNPKVDTDWDVTTYYGLTAQSLLIVLSFLIFLVLIGAWIIFLHYREKEEDKRNADPLLKLHF